MTPEQKQKWKRFFRKYWHWMVVALIFLWSIMFWADLTIFGYFRTKSSISQLKSEMSEYQAQIERDSLFLEQLKDDAFLEKYAREKHLMYADDEQLFIIE